MYVVIILDQEKGQRGMKKGQGGRSALSNKYYYQKKAKNLNPMTLNEMHFESNNLTSTLTNRQTHRLIPVYLQKHSFAGYKYFNTYMTV